MSNPIQPQFKILVYEGSHPNADINKGRKSFDGTGVKKSSTKGYLDITACVGSTVTYEEEASLLNTLSFSVEIGDRTIDANSEVTDRIYTFIL